MRSEVFLRENLIALLTAVATAHSDLAARLDDREAEVYSAGFQAALRAIAAALSIELRPDVLPTHVRTVDPFGKTSHSSLDGVVIRLQTQRQLPDHFSAP